jgi:hypothetical protein
VYGGGADLRFIPVVRDPSAWYHIVIAVDIDQAISANTVKCWINGVQITTVGTQGGSPGTPSWPTSATNWPINQAGVYQRIGGNAGGGTLDGQFAEVNFIDGVQLQPTLFGQLDTNNAWVPVAYTGSYGTNGFYLPFNNAATSQTLGYDASLTGTPTYGADQDPYRGSVALHLTGNGPAGGQNNSFADSGPNNYAISKTASPVATSFPAQGSFSPFPLNTNTPYNPAVHGASAYFPGSNTTLTSTVPAFGTGNFTIEFWYYPTDLSGTNRNVLDNRSTTGDSTSPFIRSNSSNGAQLCIVANSSTQYAVTPTLTVNAWQHVAFVRTSGSVTSYVNGVAGTTSALATNFTSTALLLGGFIDTQASPYGTTAYISSLRITPAAIYTAAFTPTMRPFGTLTNNLLTFSEDFANSGWGKDGGISVTPNYGIAPDGNPNMTLMSRAAGTLSNWAALTWANFVGAGNNAGKTYTFSIWVQAVSGTVGGSIAISDVIYNTNTVAFTATTTAQRVSLSYNGPSGTWNASSAYIGGGINLNSVGTSVLVWGAQLEVASAASNYTPTPANFSTAPSLLLNFANAAVADSTGANNIITPGTATISSASKYGSGALTFDGSGGATNSSSMIIATNSNLAMGTNDFTIEFWLNSNTGNDNYRRIVSSSNGAFTSGTMCFRHQIGGSFLFGNTSAAVTCTLTPGTWYHICYSRKNYTGYAYLNGQLVGTYTDNNNYTEQIQWLGGYYTAGNEQYSGLLDDVRITKGIARYQATFAPPSRALPETGGKSFVTTNVNAGVVKQFTTVGTTSWTAPTDVTQVEVLVVAGGGGGVSGGGGSGGVIYNNSYPVTPGQTYTVSVGAGGNAGNCDIGAGTTGTNGGNSVFGALTAIGGGAGGQAGGAQAGVAGGSGGGAAANGGSANNGGAGTAGQGFAGGANGGFTTSPYGVGGGGGAGAVGVSATSAGAFAGGGGLQFGISGTAQFYAGGGGAGAYTGAGAGGAGGSSVGGTGSTGNTNNSTAGATNTGSGGGGGRSNNLGSAGGSGIVIVRYTTAAVGNTSDATTDNLTDSPTLYGHDMGLGGEVVGNYATFNPIYAQSATVTLSNGNLTASNPSTWVRALGTIAVSTGKWYFESTPSAGNWHMTGVEQPIYGTTHIGGSAGTKGIALVYDPSNTRGDISYNGGNSVYTGGSATFNTGDIIGVALDLDNNNVKLYKNNVLQYNLSNLLQAGAYYTFGVSLYSGGTISGNFGQRAWAYTPPQGFSALTTKNLPRPAVGSAAANPNQYFGVSTWTQGATDVTLVNAGGFQPDLVWIKSRSVAQNHYLMDSVRGTTSLLRSNGTSAESTGFTWITFNSNGFTPSSANTVTNTYTYVAWQWRAAGTAVTNNSGTIASQVSANTTSGFSIVTYTGNGLSTATVGHGLGVVPAMIIHSARSTTTSWFTNHVGIPNAWIQLYDISGATTGGGTNGAIGYQSTNTTTTFGFLAGASTVNNVNQSGATYVAYCWAEVAGFSKFGSYDGNSSTDGPFIYCGFKPAMVIIKGNFTAAASQWFVYDSGRDPVSNPVTSRLVLNTIDTETLATDIDFVSNGFKLRYPAGGGGLNSTGFTYIYAAFAEKPFGNTNGTAR